MKVLILDADELNMSLVSAMIEQIIDEVLIFKYTSPFAFVTGICDELKGDADIAFIHILNNTDKNISMARNVQDYFPHLKLVFYSENTISAESVFWAVPSFFFKLPVQNNRIVHALNRIKEEIIYNTNNSLKIISKGKLIKLKHESINYMESEGRKICVYSTIGNYETSNTMENMLHQLPAYFYRCHRSYIVNIKKITSISCTQLCILRKDIIPVSRNLKTELIEILKKI